jgi:hypothetical protein
MGKWKRKKKTKRKRRGISQEQKRKAPPFLKALYDRATSQMGKSQRRDYGIEKLLICSVADDAIVKRLRRRIFPLMLILRIYDWKRRSTVTRVSYISNHLG